MVSLAAIMADARGVIKGAKSLIFQVELEIGAGRQRETRYCCGLSRMVANATTPEIIFWRVARRANDVGFRQLDAA